MGNGLLGCFGSGFYTGPISLYLADLLVNCWWNKLSKFWFQQITGSLFCLSFQPLWQNRNVGRLLEISKLGKNLDSKGTTRKDCSLPVLLLTTVSLLISLSKTVVFVFKLYHTVWCCRRNTLNALNYVLNQKSEFSFGRLATSQIELYSALSGFFFFCLFLQTISC